MVAPAIAAAAISAGANIIGGIFDRKQRKKDAYAISPAGIRKNSEAAGFNPLVFAGAQQSLPYGPVFGSSIANAASQGLATYQGAKSLELSEQRLQMDNKRLTKQLQKATLNPVVTSNINPSSFLSSNQETITSGPQTGLKYNGLPPVADYDVRGKNLVETFMSSGTPVNIPVGPDLDEILSGTAIAAIAEAKRFAADPVPTLKGYGRSLRDFQSTIPNFAGRVFDGVFPDFEFGKSSPNPYTDLSSFITNQPATNLNSRDYRRSTSSIWK